MKIRTIAENLRRQAPILPKYLSPELDIQLVSYSENFEIKNLTVFSDWKCLNYLRVIPNPSEAIAEIYLSASHNVTDAIKAELESNPGYFLEGTKEEVFGECYYQEKQEIDATLFRFKFDLKLRLRKP